MAIYVWIYPCPPQIFEKNPNLCYVYQWKYIIYVKPSNQENQLLTYISDNFKYNSDYTRSYSDHKKCTFCKTWIPCFHQIYLGILQTYMLIFLRTIFDLVSSLSFVNYLLTCFAKSMDFLKRITTSHQSKRKMGLYFESLKTFLYVVPIIIYSCAPNQVPNFSKLISVIKDTKILGCFLSRKTALQIFKIFWRNNHQFWET